MPYRDHVPKLRHHKTSGRAVVTLSGRDIYVGRWGTEAAKARYDELVGHWLAEGRRGDPAALDGPEGLTISELILAYYRHCETYYAPRRTCAKELSRVVNALDALNKLYGSTPAATFGPRAFKTVRASLVEAPPRRGGRVGDRKRQRITTINQKMQVIKMMFRWAVAEELVPGEVVYGLGAVNGLRRGESFAENPEKITPVPEAHFRTTLRYLTPTVRAMAELQWCCGMRSGELVTMRSGDIDVSGKLWVYVPREHKTDRHGIERPIYLGPRAQAIVRPFLRANLDEFIFRPAEAEAARRRALTTTGRGARKRKASPKRRPGERFSADSYRRAIERACDQAFPPPKPLGQRESETVRAWRARLTNAQRVELRAWYHRHRWTPLRLRHACGTRIRKELGLDFAQAVLGHTDPRTTLIYAERDKTLAQTAMDRIG